MTKQQNDGAWVQYEDGAEPVIVRVFSSEVAALRAAVEDGDRVVRIRFGETISEALARPGETRVKVTVGLDAIKATKPVEEVSAG